MTNAPQPGGTDAGRSPGGIRSREEVGQRHSGERFSGEASASLQPDRCVGLLLPPLDVHAEYKEPEH